MKRIRLVAAREFVTTVSNKGFIIGLLIMPALAFLLIRVAPKIVNSRSPEVHGDIAVIDPTGQVMPELRKVLDPGYIQRLRVQEALRRISESGGAAGGSNAGPFSGRNVPPPVLRILERPADAAIQKEKDWLMEKTADPTRFALIVIHPDAVARNNRTGIRLL